MVATVVYGVWFCYAKTGLSVCSIIALLQCLFWVETNKKRLSKKIKLSRWAEPKRSVFK